jgi:hypothetical protein
VKDAFPGQSPCFELQSFELQSFESQSMELQGMKSLGAEIGKHIRDASPFDAKPPYLITL